MWKNKHLPYIYSSLYSSLYLFIQNTYIYSSSRFNFNHTTIISISFCIRVPNFVQIQQPVADLVGFSGWRNFTPGFGLGDVLFSESQSLSANQTLLG